MTYGPAYIPTYFVTFCLAIVTVIWIGYISSGKNRKVLWFALVLLASGMLGARFFFTIFWLRAGFIESSAFFFSMKNGLSSFGAFVGVIAGALGWHFISKKEVWKMLDYLSTGLMLGLAIGRVGCLAAGCCHGTPTTVPWAIYYKDALRHPAQAYDLLNALVVFGIVQKIRKFRMRPGSVFLLTLAMYSFGRIIVEFFREGPAIGMMTYSQIFYAMLLVGCTGLFLYRSKLWPFRGISNYKAH